MSTTNPEGAHLPLAGKQILVVRPQTLSSLGGDRLVERLAADGALVHHLPVMSVTPIVDGLAAEQASSAVINLDHFKAAIFVSRPAAQLGLELIDSYWPQLPANTQFYAVGDSTAGLLRSYPMAVQTPHRQFTSEGLLELPELQHVNHQKILILRGAGGRELLADQLQQRGAEVTYAELYRREPIVRYQAEITRLLQQRVDAVVVHSGNIFHALLQQLDGTDPELRLKLMATVLLVPSERVAELAVAAGFQSVITAPSAMPEEMVSALCECYISGSD